MSADPEMPVNDSRYSGGHVIKSMWYTRSPTGGVEVVNLWRELGSHEWNQWIVPPATEDMHKQHPCFALNRTLLECSEAQPQMMLLAGRCAACNEPRKALMVCLTKNKQWKAPQEKKAWYHFW